MKRLVETYLSADPRTLGLFRIVFGLVLLADLAGRWRGIDHWYTDGGLLPGSAMAYMRSLFLLAESREQALLGMVLCAVAFSGLTVGICTRAFQLASFVAVVSLNNRIGVLENGGDIVLNLLSAWTLFLPLGRRFSVDALLVARRRSPRHVGAPVVSLAALALLLQLATIYLFNFLNKTGDTWSDGSAVYYTLHQDSFTTPFAVWMRESVPYPILQGMTWATLALEAAAVALILSPVWTRWLRLVAIVSLAAMHIGFTSCLALGSFSWAMLSFLTLLLTREHWEWLGRFRRWAAAPSVESGAHRARSILLTRVTCTLREALVVVLLVASFGVLKDNPVWPAALTYEQPRTLEWIVRYPRLLQIWYMFSPDPPRSERAIVVEARTRGGRNVDPYNEVASRAPDLARDPVVFKQRFMEEGLPRLGQSQFFAAYSQRITQERWKVFHGALRDWILRYPERTGDPADAIVRFEVHMLRNFTAQPGTVAPRRQLQRLIRYPEESPLSP